MDIWLFRHAESDFNTRQDEYVGGRSNETPLTPYGEEQAHRLGLWIVTQELIPDAAYASPAVRTLETGRLALETACMPMPLRIDDRLQEMSQGPAEGRRRDDVYTKEVIEDVQTRLLDFALPDGESMNNVADRGTEVIEEIPEKEKSGSVFVFTHGYFIRCAVARYQGWSHAEVRNNEVGNASATRLTFTGDSLLPEIEFNIHTQ